jgi:hypothetical protein
MYSSIYSIKDINKSLKKIKNRIKSLYTVKDIFNKDSIISSKRSIYLDRFFFKDSLERTIFEVMLASALDLEIKSPGSFEKFFDEFFNSYKSSYDDKNISYRKLRKSDLLDILNLFCQEERQREILLCALEMSGNAGKIFIEKSHGNKSSIEKISGFSFEAGCPIIKGKVEIKDVAVIVVDAFVESVSEIHHLLEECNSSKRNVVLVIRGANNDVLQTLKVNLERGSLSVYPIISKFDVHGINMLNDIATVVGADVFSSHKGDLVSGLKLSSSKDSHKVIVERDQITFFNEMQSTIKSHINFLMKKRQESAVEIQEILTKRIKSLSSSKVIIKLPDDSNFIKDKEALDKCLRKISISLGRGIADNETNVIKSAVAACVDQINQIDAVVNFN